MDYFDIPPRSLDDDYHYSVSSDAISLSTETSDASHVSRTSPEQSCGEAIVKEALDEFKSTLTLEDVVRIFTHTSLEELWREVLRVEQETESLGFLRSLRSIEPFLRALQSYASVIEVLCPSCTQKAFVWVPRGRRL